MNTLRDSIVNQFIVFILAERQQPPTLWKLCEAQVTLQRKKVYNKFLSNHNKQHRTQKDIC